MRRRNGRRWRLLIPALLAAAPAWAAGEAEAAAEVQHNVNVVWTLVAAVMVFFMQAGFAMVEAGFTRAKNAVNILMKNLMDFSIGSLAFFLVGFGLMFGATGNGVFGGSLFGMGGIVGSEGGTAWGYTFLIFQTVFAATAATIVSGAMAERTKFTGYLAYSLMICLFIYPVFGKWAWGSLFIAEGAGWLENLGTGAFCDFAGSTVVHSVGGWLALAGAIVLGPRIGKYAKDRSPRAIPGHSIPLAALGVFILWFGWFGFNPGSTTTGDGEIGRVAVTTNLAAAAGAVAAMLTSWKVLKNADASMALNGALAGLVAITAPCYTVTPLASILIGVIAGVLVVFSVLFFDRVLRIDDPVGAISVHGVCGLWGTLSCGLFNAEAVLGIGEANSGLFYGGGFSQLVSQLIGAGAGFVWAFGTGLVLFTVIRKTIGLRVSEEEELRGLDIGEHGMEAYSGFQFFTTQ
ncbi:ammonium transporter [Kiritimatiella glycovorans]|uniref:Ammonium transporter n=1 Tax=Kiritimatiella glycovorans TaxID=1307763 RepID=A0A0G3EKD5_9BACT|nr:ammonium transporter [Kiritimatiella glycovorans]AKJ64639.1 Ammonia transporter [Kiritimatiella glycovorans]